MRVTAYYKVFPLGFIELAQVIKAGGMTNLDIEIKLGIAASTVRKYLNS